MSLLKRLWACKTAAVALALVGLLTNAAGADCRRSSSPNLRAQPIYVQNNSNTTIWVAAKYMPAGSRSYVTDGFWRVDPGQKKLIVYNNAVYVYFHARDDQGRVWRGGGNHDRQTIRGESVDMYAIDTGHDFDPRVMTFFDR
jgi:uncharacterized membrane protein